jgi:outer membrane protein insertion porin family
LLFGVSVNSDAGLNGSIVFNERNFDLFGWPDTFDEFRTGRAFRGGGQELRLEATPGTSEQRYLLSFREPFLFDTRYALQAGGYYYDFAYHDEYTESRLGTRLTISRRLDRNWSVEGTLRLEDVGVHHLPFDAPPEIARDQGDHFLVGFRAGVTFDTRDSYIRPTEGVLANLAFEQFTGDDTFPKIVLGASEYWTVAQRKDGSGRQVLSLRGEVGYAGSHTPVFESFHAGGFRTLRGFAFRGVGPSDRGIEVGGDFELLGSLEYQAPILASDRLYAVGFIDSGTVERSVEIRDYRISTGLGLRIQIPQLAPVPIALDFAVPVVKAHGDHTQLFSFLVGFYY